MREFKIHKADPIGETEVLPATIVIDTKLSGNKCMDGMDIDDIYIKDAGLLADALFYSLPQGTFDRLIVKLMKRKMSAYRGITRS